MNNMVEADKNLLKELVLKFGKAEVDSGIHVWQMVIENPFNNLLLIALNRGFGDSYTFKSFYDIKFRARDISLAEFIEKQINQKKLNKLVKDLRLAQNLEKTFEGLIRLNKKYKLDKKTDLRDINADEFYTDLKKIEGFGAEEGTNLPWAICDLVRLWNLRVPKDLKLGKRCREKLEKLGLSSDDFNVNDYSYVDFAMFNL